MRHANLHMQPRQHAFLRVVMLERSQNALAVQVAVTGQMRQCGEEVHDVWFAVHNNPDDVQFHGVL
eukprot:6201249-Pleurochrysis_carterae.AAC.1